MGLIHIRNNSKDEGLKCLLKAHELDPTEIDTLLKLSEIYLRDNNTVRAEKYIKIVLEMDPNLPEAQVTLGRIYEQKGDED